MKGIIIYSQNVGGLFFGHTRVKYTLMFDGNKKQFRVTLPKEYAIFNSGDRIDLDQDDSSITIKKIGKEK